MNAKTWLGRARRIDAEIAALMEAREKMIALMTKVTQTLSGDVVQSTKDPHKFDRLAEFDSTIFQRVDELNETKIEILLGISKLKDGRYREVLIRRYVTMQTFSTIAGDMNFSERQILRLHGRALLKMEELLNGV